MRPTAGGASKEPSNKQQTKRDGTLILGEDGVRKCAYQVSVFVTVVLARSPQSAAAAIGEIGRGALKAATHMSLRQARPHVQHGVE